MNFENTLEFARELDKQDELKNFRDQFYIPLLHKKESVYLCGHTLGLQPKTTHDKVVDELEDWANYGKEGRQHARNPWMNYHDQFPLKLTSLTGALPHEIVVMNSLTTNLHLLLKTFYRLQMNRYKIICEENAFSSDLFALQSHVQTAGLPKDALIRVAPREGEDHLRTEDILEAIEHNKDELALVFLGGVNYMTGQVLDMETITKAAHNAGAKCGFDLAHAIGNIDLQLHSWHVDFAVWCSYKYLNSGPGAIGGAYIHEKYARDTGLLRLAGWWGNSVKNRFEEDAVFSPVPTAEGWQLSSPPILLLAAHIASLDLFKKAGFRALLKKADQLKQWTYFVLEEAIREGGRDSLEIISPKNPEERGSMISVRIKENADHFMEVLRMNSIIADLLHGNILRVTATPLYNTYEDIYILGQVVKNNIPSKLKMVQQ